MNLTCLFIAFAHVETSNDFIFNGSLTNAVKAAGYRKTSSKYRYKSCSGDSPQKAQHSIASTSHFVFGHYDVHVERVRVSKISLVADQNYSAPKTRARAPIRACAGCRADVEDYMYSAFFVPARGFISGTPPPLPSPFSHVKISTNLFFTTCPARRETILLGQIAI